MGGGICLSFAFLSIVQCSLYFFLLYSKLYFLLYSNLAHVMFFYFAPWVRQSGDIKRAENRLSCKYGQYRLYLKFNVGATRQEIGMFKISDAAGDLGIPGEGGDNSNTDIKCKC